MSITIENRTSERVLLRFNSGLTWHLGPYKTLTDVEHVEVKGNHHIGRLQEKHIIKLHKDHGKKSSDMNATEAIAFIENTPLKQLQSFISSDEKRTTVLRAIEEKRSSKVAE